MQQSARPRISDPRVAAVAGPIIAYGTTESLGYELVAPGAGRMFAMDTGPEEWRRHPGNVPDNTALGFVAVFAGATNTQLACTVIGAELFGSGPLLLLAAARVTAYVLSSHRGIYGSRRVATPKAPTVGLDRNATLTINDVARTRRHWLAPPTTTPVPSNPKTAKTTRDGQNPTDWSK